MKFLTRYLAIIAACWLGSSAVALAATTGSGTATEAPGSYSYTTTLIDDRYYSAGAYEGVLNISLASDGTLNGTYRAIDSGMSQIVTGGFDGDRIWLNVGANGFHVTGTFADGRIVGYTHLTSNADQFRFEADPASKQL